MEVSTPPSFSLADFNQLISAALDCNTPLPTLTFPGSVPPSLLNHLSRKASSTLLQMPQSRVRGILSKVKKRASALMVKRNARIPPPTVVKTTTTTMTLVSPSLDDDCDTPMRLFTPYLPLASQYERAAVPLSDLSHSFSSSPPSSESTSSCSHPPPPSPTASFFSQPHWTASECSGFGTSESPPLHHTSSPSPFPYPHTTSPRPWSVISMSVEETEEDFDPFAKDAVSVVHRSCEILPAGSTPVSQRRRAARHSGVRPGRVAEYPQEIDLSEPASSTWSYSRESGWPSSPTPTPGSRGSGAWVSASGCYAAGATATAGPSSPGIPRSQSVAQMHAGLQPEQQQRPRPRASSPFPLSLRRM